MQLSNANLVQLMGQLGPSSDVDDVALAHNFWFDRRPDPDRSETYNSMFAPLEATRAAFEQSHARYIHTRIYVAPGRCLRHSSRSR